MTEEKETAGSAEPEKEQGQNHEYANKKQGNSFWKLRAKHGRGKLFETPGDLWDACTEYFQAIEDNPLTATELVKFQGVATLAYLPRMRAMTICGLCIFLDITQATWYLYKKRDDFIEVCTRVNDIIRVQKFEGACADMLNPAIIARDLGLADGKGMDDESVGAGVPVVRVYERKPDEKNEPVPVDG